MYLKLNEIMSAKRSAMIFVRFITDNRIDWLFDCQASPYRLKLHWSENKQFRIRQGNSEAIQRTYKDARDKVLTRSIGHRQTSARQFTCTVSARQELTSDIVTARIRAKLVLLPLGEIVEKVEQIHRVYLKQVSAY